MPDPRRLAGPLAVALSLGQAVVALPPGSPAEAWLAERDGLLPPLAAALAAPGPAVAPAPFGAPPDLGPLQVVGSDVRLALAQMALAAGAEGQVAIAGAQGQDGPGAIYVLSGTATLDGLLAAADGTELESVLRREGDAVVASRPLVVLAPAALALGPDDTLVLDGAAGTFVLVLGRLTIDGATLRAQGAAAEGFRPFVAAVGAGPVVVRGARFEGLGSDLAPLAAGLAVAAGEAGAAGPAPLIEGNDFVDVAGLTLLRAEGGTLRDNTFAATRGVAVLLRQSDGVEVAGNLVAGPLGPVAARVDGPSTGVRLLDNVFLDGEGAGLRATGDVRGLDLRGNVVAGFEGRAVVLEGGPRCVRVAGNLLTDNGGGVAAREAGDVLVAGNALLGNRGPGVALSRSLPEAGFQVAGNLLDGNQSGVRAVMVEALSLSANDLSGQAPRHLEGDLAQHVPLLLAGMRGDALPSFAFDHARAAPAAPLTAQALDRAFADCRAEAGT